MILMCSGSTCLLQLTESEYYTSVITNYHLASFGTFAYMVHVQSTCVIPPDFGPDNFVDHFIPVQVFQFDILVSNLDLSEVHISIFEKKTGRHQLMFENVQPDIN